MSRSRWVGAIIGIALAVAAAGAAQAHTSLVAAAPAPGSAVAQSPVELRLTFDAALQPGSTLWLYAATFERVPDVETVTDGSQLVATLPSPLPPAAYTVQWLAVDADGHSTEGSYGFTVLAARRMPWPAIALAGGTVAVLGLVVFGRVKRNI